MDGLWIEADPRIRYSQLDDPFVSDELDLLSFPEIQSGAVRECDLFFLLKK